MPDMRTKVPCGRVEVLSRDAADRRKIATCMVWIFMRGSISRNLNILRCDHFGFGSFRGGREKQW